MSIGLDVTLLMGNLTSDVELRYTQGGAPVANFSLAINREWTTKEGDRQKDVCYVPVVVWGKQAEQCGEYLKKGDQAMVTGRHHSSSWETRSGERRSKMEIVAERVIFIGLKKERAVPGEQPASQARNDVPF